MRYLPGSRIELLFANGNFSEYDPVTQLWTVTNNKGYRRRKRNKDSLEFDVESVPCATQTDSYTGARQMIREDGTLGVWYREGVTFTIHKDGTRICTREDCIIVEKDGYAPVRIWASTASGEGSFTTQFAPAVVKDEERTPE